MLMQEERELVVEYGKKMSAARLSTGTSGNISIYNAEKGLVALSPSGMDYFSTTPEDVVILNLYACHLRVKPTFPTIRLNGLTDLLYHIN